MKGVLLAMTTTTGGHGQRLWLTGLALWAGSGATIFMLLSASGYAMWGRGLTKMPEFLPVMYEVVNIYAWVIWVPSLIVLALVWVYSHKNFPALANRIWAGLGAGAVATLALDTFRQLGVIHGWLPMDTVQLFGKMILGPQSPELAWTTAGLAYHFLNGASFGAFYAIIWGKAHWMWAVAWALLVELGMMTLPPMAPTVGLFGSQTGSPALFLITLVAHVAYGVMLGLLVQHWVKTPGSVFRLLSGANDSGKET